MDIRTFTPPKNATTIDICLNTYGTLDLLTKLLIDNDIIDINQLAVGNEIYQYDFELINDYPMINQIVERNIKFTTGDSIIRDTFNPIDNLLIESSEILLSEDSDDFTI